MQMILASVPQNSSKEAPAMPADITFTYFESSMGIISIAARNGVICALDISKKGLYETRKELAKIYPDSKESDKPFRRIILLLDRYLKGEHVDFDIDVDLRGNSDFVCRVLSELRKIPYGELRSYGDIGKALGYPMAARAVGQAVGANPIPIIIPCHRIIQSNGTLGGFSLGKEIKKKLLVLEGFKVIQNGRVASAA